jgi:hypothetical protein
MSGSPYYDWHTIGYDFAYMILDEATEEDSHTFGLALSNHKEEQAAKKFVRKFQKEVVKHKNETRIQ